MSPKKLGDGIMALFGYPLAQENDAERAVRAGLGDPARARRDQREECASGRPKLDARIGVETGAVVVDSDGRGVRRRAQCRRASAGGRRARDDLDDRESAAPGRGAVRRRGSRRACAQGRAGAGDALPDRARQRRRQALRAARADAAGRPRRGAGDADAALGARAGRRRPVPPDRRRAGPRQVAADRGVSRPAGRYAAHLGRMEPPRNCCRIRPCTRSPIGAGSASAARTCPPSGGSPISRRRSQRGQARSRRIRAAAGAAARHPAAARSRRRISRPRNCGAGRWRRCWPG